MNTMNINYLETPLRPALAGLRGRGEVSVHG